MTDRNIPSASSNYSQRSATGTQDCRGLPQKHCPKDHVLVAETCTARYFAY